MDCCHLDTPDINVPLWHRVRDRVEGRRPLSVFGARNRCTIRKVLPVPYPRNSCVLLKPGEISPRFGYFLEYAVGFYIFAKLD